MRKHVLVIDDEDDIREVAVASLELVADWKVSEASSGEEGIARAAAERPDAILLDVMMPGMDGPATLERLRAHPSTRDIPVIFLTAKVQAADHRRFRELGVQGVIAKPFDAPLLARTIARTLNWPGGA